MNEVMLNDVRLLIEMRQIGLAETLVRVCGRLHVMDLALMSLGDSEQMDFWRRCIELGALVVHEVTESDLDWVFGVQRTLGPAVSLVDCAAVSYADRNGLTLLTDCPLLTRLGADGSGGLQLMRTVQLFDRIVSLGMLTADMAINRLNELERISGRIGKEAVHQRMQSWIINEGRYNP